MEIHKADGAEFMLPNKFNITVQQSNGLWNLRYNDEKSGYCYVIDNTKYTLAEGLAKFPEALGLFLYNRNKN